MGIVSVRFNSEEEKILKKLTNYYQEDRSKLLKKMIVEMYEDLIDKNEIAKFETKEKSKKVKFHPANEILAQLNK
jgi:mRNA-degrading endonuclease RelE of RelBE toxin-antitoxin system